MIIMIFSESYYPYNCGVTEAVQNLIDNLRALGHTVYLVTPAYPNYSCGQGVIRIPSYHVRKRNYRAAYPWFWFSKQQQLIKRIVQLKPDILHSHGPYATHRLATIIAKKLHIPLLMTWHTLVIDYMECWMKEAKFPTLLINLASMIVKRWWIKPMCDQTDLILSPTNFVREMLKSYGVKSQIQVLPLAINLETPKIPQEIIEELRIQHRINQDKVLLYVGRVTPEKNINLLLQVFRNILTKRNDCHLLIVGGGDENGRYQQLAKQLGIPDGKITFTGEIPREQTTKHYMISGLFLFPSTIDNTPRAILEAMLFMPVVAVRAGGVPDLVIDNQTGILVAADNIVEGMAKAALQILSSPLLQENMKKLAYQEVMSAKYNPAKYAETMEEIYQAVIDQQK